MSSGLLISCTLQRRSTSITPPSGSGLNPISLSYDSANRVTGISSVANGSGHEVDYSYDDFDRITKAVYKDAAGNTVATISYSYDNDGNLLERSDSHGNTTFTYDGLNRAIHETLPDGWWDNYGYDPAGNLTSISDAGGVVNYTYDKANQLVTVTDPHGSTPIARLTYDTDGNLLTTTYASGASVASTYNTLDQLTKVTDTYKTSSGATARLSYSYTYSGSLRQTMTDQANNVTTYGYDQLNRLTSASTTGPNPSSYSYKLDGNGNLTQITANANSTYYGYNPGNEICWSSTSSSGSCGSPPSGANPYTYDPDGNQTSNGNGLTATYNALQQTTSITQGGTSTNYSYIGEGQDQLSLAGTDSLENDILGLAATQNSSGSDYYTRTVAGRKIDERTPSGTYNYLYDGNGSVVGLTDTSAHLVNQYSYDPYGNQTTITSTVPNPFGYQDGHQTSGLNHFGARYQNPTDARWTQQDPLHHIQSLTQNDRYEYAGDDPTNLTDPSGEWAGQQACAILGSILSMCGGLNSPYEPMEPPVVRYTGQLLTDAGNALSRLGDEETSLEDELGSAGDVLAGLFGGG